MFPSLTRRMRPTTTTQGLPGNATTAAHAGPPKAGQASHHKLSTLDAPMARKELLSPEHAPAARVAAVADQARGPEAPPARPPRHKLTRLAGTVVRGVARAAALVPGQPKAHDKLLRYQGTPSGQAAAGSGLAAISAELSAALAAEEAQRRREAELDEIDALEWLTDSHLARVGGDLDLRARRAMGVSNRAHDLGAEQLLLDARLETHQAAIEATLDALARTEALREPVARAVQADREDLAALPAPAGPLAQMLRQERLDEAAGRQAALAEIDQTCEGLRQILQSHRDGQAEAAGRFDQVKTALAQALRSARITAGEIGPLEDDIQALRALKASLAPARERRAESLAAATTEARQARQALDLRQQQRLAETLASPPGFNGAGDIGPLQQAATAWAGGLREGLSRFGADALSPADAASIAMYSLALATGGDAARAAEVMQELATASVAALVPPIDAVAPQPLSPQARQAAWLLAAVPRGMQVLAQLLPPDALAPRQAEAMRLSLRAELAQNEPGPHPELHAWLDHGRRAAARALHAADPGQALASAPAAERAVYHAMRNGYFTNAPGSPYDKSNQHLQKLADWLHANQQAAAGRGPGRTTPLSALGEALTLAEATALPTPRRRAGEHLRQAAGQVVDWLMARRQLLGPGQLPSAEEVALQALAEHVRWLPEGTDLAAHRLDARAWQAIDERRGHLHGHLQADPQRQGPDGAAPVAAPCALAAAWEELRSKGTTRHLADLFGGLARHLADMPAASAAPPAEGSHAHAERLRYWAGQAATRLTGIQGAVGEAQRLLREGDPARVTSGPAMFDFFRDMLGMLEWRDKLRMVGQSVYGLNTGALSAALPGGVLGAKFIAGVQHNEDRLIEFYMGRTGLYVQIGEQAVHQAQLGAGVTGGYSWELDGDDHQAKFGLGGAADWRMKGERGIESGVQLRIPRLGKGRELELRAEFMDMFEHLLHIASPGPDGAPARRDWLAELLAHHPSLNMGLVDQATRRSSGTELNASAFAGFRFIEDGDRARRIALAGSAGLKFRQDRSETATTVAGYMTTVYRDSTAQAKTELTGHLTAGAQLGRWGDANLSAGWFDLGRNVEVRATGKTRFCTLFTFGDEIDPTRSDRATDYLDFDAFEREVRSEWADWVRYGYGKLPPDIERAARYAVAERQLEDFMSQARDFATHNSFATMYADKVLQPDAAPLLDAARARIRLARLAGDEARAAAEEQAFDDLLAQPGLWEPTILMLREKTKLQVERGVDLLLKLQRNRIAESQRTVGQWILYEPVPHPQPGTPEVPAARRWAAEP